MLAVRAATDKISKVAKTALYKIACINRLRNTVLSSSVENINTLKAKLVNVGFKYFYLNVAFAFYLLQTNLILDKFKRIAKQSVIF
jgi:hypothetical protein